MEASRKRNMKGATGCLSASANRGGFTLVEMLTVIVIIGILAGLIVAAAVPAISAARRATIQTEITQLGIGLEKYKTERGDYPPDFAGVNDGNATIRTNARQAVIRHIRKAFPRMRLTGTPTDQWNQLRLLVKQASSKDPSIILANVDSASGLDINQLSPGSALAFWLGGPTDTTQSSSNKLVGFSANPANPFAVGGSREDSLYEFDETRLLGLGPGGDLQSDGIIQYVPPHVQNQEGGTTPPYVYFRARSNGYLRENGGANWISGDKCSDFNPHVPSFSIAGCGTCAPYAASAQQASSSDPVVYRWKEPKKYQIICSGLDGIYGENPTVGSTVRFLNADQKTAIVPEEDDNITSFTQGKLEDRPEE